MTTIKIDIRSTGATTHPDDRVVMWAPEVRARIGGGLVSTAPFEVELVDGQATVGNAEPGPLMVRFECLGVADTSEKRGIVPDSGEVTLDDVLELKYSWSPPIISAALQQIIDEMNRALGAVGSAVEGEMGDLVRSAESAARSSALSAATSSTESASAHARADSAETKVDAVSTRLTSLEAMGGLAPQSPVDGQTANLLTQPDTLTRAALDASRVGMSVSAAESVASLGPELITADGWTLGAGWTGDLTTGFVHAGGDTVLTWDGAHLPPGDYQISFSASTQIKDIQDLDVTIGDSPAPYIYGLGTNIVTSVSVGTSGNLAFTPVGTRWVGTITNVSVRQIVGEVTASLIFRDDAGASAMRVRVGLASQQNFYVGDVAGQKNTSGVYNVAIGADSMGENTSGYWNTSVGWQAMRNNTSGTRNVALGMRALTNNTTGYRNIAVGQSSMVLNTTGQGNIAMGADAMLLNATGNENVAIGHIALGSNPDGSRNIAIGHSAMNNAKTSTNVAIGDFALYASESAGNVAIGSQAARYTKAGGVTAVGNSAGVNNVSGVDNTTIGFESGRGRSFGIANFNRVTAIGKNAGRRLGTGHDENTLIGYAALANADGGVDNTVIGTNAGLSGVGDVLNRNVLIGKRAGAVLKTGADENTVIGTQAGNVLTTGKQNVLIGYNVQASSPTASNEINIGNLIKGSNVPGYFEVTIDGKLRVANLPKQDPQSTNQVWNDNGTLKVSA